MTIEIKSENISRNEFLLAVSGAFFFKFYKKYNPPLAFNTLACPTWGMETIIKKAAQYGYNGVELRGMGSQMNLTLSEELSKSKLPSIKRLCKEHDVKIINLNASAVMHEYETAAKTRNIDEAKAYIDLAAELGCCMVRVFPDFFPAGKSREFALETIKQNYASVLQYAQGTGVQVLLDAHGDLVKTSDLKTLMLDLIEYKPGIIWDYFNMHLKTGETAEYMYQNLKPFIKLVQLKDGHLLPNQKYEYTLCGQGQMPLINILKILKENNYKSFISFEWEKRWHPELADADIALPHFVEFVKKNF